MKKNKMDFAITKKNDTYIISEKNSRRKIYRVTDVPTYNNFNLKKPFLSGVGSVINVAGNYYSFDKYLSANNDCNAILSDWKKVGDYFLEAFSIYKGK